MKAGLTASLLLLWPLALFADITGIWQPENRRSRIEIKQCGDAYCGRILSLSEPVYPSGHPRAGQVKTDAGNRDSSLQGRPLEGLLLFSGVRQNQSGAYEGSIYDPETGRSYDCVLRLRGSSLEVRPYVFFEWLGASNLWTR